jgi:hypothetical protein
VFPQGNDAEREEKVVKLEDKSQVAVWRVIPAKSRLPKREGVGFWFRSLNIEDPKIKQV